MFDKIYILISPLIISVVLIVFNTFFSISQKEASNWIFPSNCGLYFDSLEISSLSGVNLAFGECTSSYSDPYSGELIFWAGPNAIYNRYFEIMPNGSNISGSVSSTQGSLIVPMPNFPNIFYVFTTTEIEGFTIPSRLTYSIVDINLANGLGDVLQEVKNITLMSPISECLSAVKHSNGLDWWIMAKGASNDYYSYLLTSEGLNTDPIISNVGIVNPNITAGQSRFSPNGNKYAVVSEGFTPGFIGINGLFSNIQLFDFDNSNGELTNPVTLVIRDSINLNRLHGLAFSSDNSKLYVGVGPQGNRIMQYDLCLIDNSTIAQAQTYIGQLSSPYPKFQLAQNGKIYISCFNCYALNAINAPNEDGEDCELSEFELPLNCQFKTGLPNFPDSYFYSIHNDCLTLIESPEISYDYHIPNVFTPNKDGINDLYHINTSGEILLFEIFNRWGQLVFYSDSDSHEWDGLIDGKMALSGVYFLKYTIKWPDGFVVNSHSFFHLIRE